MERLTKRNSEGIAVLKVPDECDRCGEPIYRLNDLGNGEPIKKLAEYEDLEEQGLLLKLQCKVGDTVWELCKCDDGIYRTFSMKVMQVVPYGSVRWVKGKEPTVWNVYAVSDYTDMYKSFYDIGKTIFLTHAAAEEALKKMNKTEE